MQNLFDGDPKTLMGAAGWIALGAGAAVVALLVGSLVPSIIPARASQSRL
jgi:hypothetical protein